MRIFAIAVALWFATFPSSSPVRAQADKPELSTVRLAVGGKSALYYLPLTVVERLGYFKDVGLDVQISDFAGGARSLQALIGGSADVVTGAYDHTIQMQAKSQHIIAVVDLGRFPGFVLAIPTAKAAAYHGPQDLKGKKIGVTAPGSSTNFMVSYLMANAGVNPADASFIGVGAGPSAVAAVRRGELDALVNSDPVISLLDSEKRITIVADTRTAEGTRQVYGGPLPAAVLYAAPAFIEKNPHTTQALVNAFVRGLRWIHGHTAEEIAAVMPPEYALGDKAVYVASIKASLAMYSPDGRLAENAGETAYKVLKRFDPGVQKAKIDLSQTFTNAFVDKVPAK
jgi:NitT/TauT family transport system substrate-binding protein